MLYSNLWKPNITAYVSSVTRAGDLQHNFASSIALKQYNIKHVAGRWIGYRFSRVTLSVLRKMLLDGSQRINQKEQALVKGTEASKIPNYFG